MKNILITGTGRSGTSLVTGILNNSGYYSGDNLYPPRAESNPTGFFENQEINGINKLMLVQYNLESKPWYKRTDKRYFSPFKPNYGQRWLSLLDFDISIFSTSEDIAKRIKVLTKKQPFAFKDPRFSYTLDVWKKHLPENTVILVVFREPYATIQSILKEVNSVEYLQNFSITTNQTEKIWINTYSRLIQKSKSSQFDFIFLNYTDLVQNTKSIVEKLSQILQVQLNTSILDKNLYNQKHQSNSVSNISKSIYTNLKCLSI